MLPLTDIFLKTVMKILILFPIAKCTVAQDSFSECTVETIFDPIARTFYFNLRRNYKEF